MLKIIEPIVSESINEYKLRGAPKIFTHEEGTLCAQLYKEIIFKMDLNKYFVNEMLCIREVISELNVLADKYQITLMRWPLNDLMFKNISIE